MALRLFINIKMPRASQEPHFIYFNVSGGVIGYLSSIFGIGGGIFSVPLLKISGMEMNKAVGTGAACAFPIAVISSASYLLLGWGRQDLPEYAFGSHINKKTTRYYHLAVIISLSKNLFFK